MKVTATILIFFMMTAGIAYSSKNFGDNNIDSNNLLLKKDIESGPWETVANVAGDTNLRAGLASGYFGYVSVSMACARNDQGDISDPKACIGGTVAGGAFALYALYRIGGGFLANRRAPRSRQFLCVVMAASVFISLVCMKFQKLTIKEMIESYINYLN